MHRWDDDTERVAELVVGFAEARLRTPKDPQWGAQPSTVLDAALEATVAPTGIGAAEALRVFSDVVLPACRPMDDPLNLAYVPTAPSIASTLFDLVVSATSIMGANWETGAGAIAAENRAIRWLADLAGFPSAAGGVFVSGGSAANLSALVAARSRHRERSGYRGRCTVAATEEVHASVRAAANVMDVDVLAVATDEAGRMTGPALRAAIASLDAERRRGLFAVVATGGTTNAGVVDDLAAVADACDEHGLWMHVDGAYGLAALCSRVVRRAFDGIERADSFGVDPHKWLFAPYDCAALVYREPDAATSAHAQHGAYLDAVDRAEWNPSDLAYHLSRRVRGLPLWFGLATHGTDAYADAVDASIEAARHLAADIRARDGLRLLVEPTLSIVVFAVDGWSAADYARWSRQRAREGRFLVVPTSWKGQPCLRICLVNPRTERSALAGILDDLEEGFPLSP